MTLTIPLIVAFLGSASVTTLATNVINDLTLAESYATAGYTDLTTLCSVSKTYVDDLSTVHPDSKEYKRLVAVTDAVCKAAASQPNNPISQAKLIVVGFSALHDVDVLLAKDDLKIIKMNVTTRNWGGHNGPGHK